MLYKPQSHAVYQKKPNKKAFEPNKYYMMPFQAFLKIYYVPYIDESKYAKQE